MTIEGRSVDQRMRFRQGKNRVSRFRYSGNKPTNYYVDGRDLQVSDKDRMITLGSRHAHDGQAIAGDTEWTAFHVENGLNTTIVQIKEGGTITIALRHIYPAGFDQAEAINLEFKHTKQ